MDTTLIGQQTKPKQVTVETGQLRFFAKATGNRNEIYSDIDAARAAGHRDLPAPPTFLFSLDALAPTDEPSLLQKLGVQISSILHGEQRFEYGTQIYAGDVITLTSEIVDIYEKRGGALKFVVTKTIAMNQDNQFVGKMINNLVIRE